MNASELKTKLQQPYSRENWLSIAKDVFKNLSILNKPIDIESNKDFVKSFRQLGFVNLEDGRNLAMIEIKVDDSKDLYRNKVELRNLTTKLIDEYNNNGVLVIYDNETGNYRFTFAAKESALNEITGQVETKETHPKRFTYLLGPGESCFTPAIQLSKLAAKGENTELKDVVDVFNVEAVNEKFFNEYKEHYTAFVTYLTNERYKRTVFNNEEKAIRDFVKKMLGRIVFLYFLQKKGWMGVPVSSTKWENGNPNFLKDLFKQAGEGNDFYPCWLVPLFETLNDEKKGETFNLPVGSKVKVPSLNGGLFEPDGINSQLLTFSPKLFTDLFEFFDQYNFTIYEDDPEERFLAVDPEMLGHIFENLLEDNKGKGTYYTPKEIVHYMCQESLVEYLYTNLSEKDEGIERVALEKLVKQKSALAVADYDEAILKALRKVKICDPAIGSGAFPMGLLHEIFDIVQLMHDLSPDVTEDIWKLDKGWSPAKVKEDIIQNSIYGVDIEKGAVEIARLRFWLSLIIDEEIPKPLPNLDYKIIVGDSLLSKFEGKVIDIEWKYTTSHGTPETKKLITAQVLKLQTLQAWQEQYFKTKSGNKQKLQLDIRNIKIDILINQLKLSKISFQHKNPKLGGYDPTPKEKQKNLENELAQRDYDKKIQKLEVLKEKDVPLEFFDWKLDFPEVMNRKEGKEGFDIVIANPPYVLISKEVFEKDYKSKYYLQEGKPDLYRIFIEQGLNLTKQHGNLNYIIPNTLLTIPSCKALRKYLLQNCRINLIINYDESVFESVSVNSIVLNVVLTEPKQSQIKILNLSSKDSHSYNYLPQKSALNNPKYEINIFVGDSIQEVFDKIKSKSVPLLGIEGVKATLGAQPYHNTLHTEKQIQERFLHNDDKKNSNYKLELGGRNIGKYVINTKGKVYVDVSKEWYTKPNLDFFRGERIILREIVGEKLIAGITEAEFISNKSCYVIKSSNKTYTNKRLLLIINSKLIGFYVQNLGDKSKQKLFPRITMNTLKNLPILDFEPKVINSMAPFVEKISKNKELTPPEEKSFDTLVYKLYQLNYEEACLIEGNTEWMTKEAYEQFQFEDAEVVS